MLDERGGAEGNRRKTPSKDQEEIRDKASKQEGGWRETEGEGLSRILKKKIDGRQSGGNRQMLGRPRVEGGGGVAHPGGEGARGSTRAARTEISAREKRERGRSSMYAQIRLTSTTYVLSNVLSNTLWQQFNCLPHITLYHFVIVCLLSFLLLRDDQLRELFDFMAEPNRGDSASARVLCEVVDEWLKVKRRGGGVLPTFARTGSMTDVRFVE